MWREYPNIILLLKKLHENVVFLANLLITWSLYIRRLLFWLLSNFIILVVAGFNWFGNNYIFDYLRIGLESTLLLNHD